MADIESRKIPLELRQKPVKVRPRRDIKYPTDVRIPFFNSFKTTDYDTKKRQGLSEIRLMVERGKGFQLISKI